MTTRRIGKFTSFDATVLTVIAVLLVTIVVVVVRGVQVGMSVVTQTPGPDITDAPLRIPISIQFDDALASEVSQTQVTISPPISGVVSIAGDTLRFTPAEPLLADTAYTVTVSAGLSGARGRTLIDPLVWRFRTGQGRVLFIDMAASMTDQLYTVPVNLNHPAPPDDTPQQLTDVAHGLWDYAVSAANGKVAFAALTDQGTANLWLLEPAAQPSLLVECVNSACSGASWSPDGQLLAYSRRNATDLAPAMISPPRLWLLDVVTGESAQIFADSQQLGYEPRWSGDGQWLSYLTPDPLGVSIFNLEDGQSAFYATSTGEPGIWHPKRLELVISTIREAEVDGNRYFLTHLLAVDPFGKQERNLSGEKSLVEDSSPAFSPDGEWIAFLRKELTGERASPGKQLWLMRADGSQAHPLTVAPEFDHGNPTWSPDGRLLAYQHFPLKGPNIVVSVWMIDVVTGEQWQLASSGQFPQWQP
jgi:hypothetical protein